jgi:mycothiol synthase
MSGSTTTGVPGPAGSPVPVADAPPLAGLAFRTCRGPADGAALADVMNAEAAACGIDELLTADEVSADLAHASDEDPARTLVIAELDGRPVAFARRAWHDRGVFRAYEHVGYVHPDVARRGLGRALLRHQAAALRDLAASHAEPDERRLFTWADERRVGASALFGAEGYAPVRWYVDMERPTLGDLPPVAAPPGLELRPADPGDAAALGEVLAAEDEAFGDHWGHHAMSPAEVDAVLAEPELDPASWRVAWDGAAIAGVVRPIVYADENARFGRRRAWIDRLSVRREWRGRGLGTALLVEALADARARGLTSAALGVDTDNTTGALGLYERLGFVRGPATVAYAKPLRSDDAPAR